MTTNGTLKYTDTKEIPAIIKKVTDGFYSGKTHSVEWRKQQIRQIWKMMDENEGYLYEALKLDVGKPRFEAQLFEMGLVKNDCLLALAQLDSWMQPESVAVPPPFENWQPRIFRQPRGVALVISPWNFPVNLSMLPLIGAAAAGCCAVLKPSELTPTVAQRLTELIPRYLDPECFAVVNGDGTVAQELLQHRWDFILFTGSRQNGVRVMQAAAKHLTPIVLELGGKSPVIVSEKANLPIVARRLVWGKFWNEGQICMAPEYVYVQEKVHDEFVELVKKV